MQRIILNNARYWQTRLEVAQTVALTEADLRTAAMALEALFTIMPAGLAAAFELTKTLHPHMKTRGYWEEWETFLDELIRLAQQYARPREEMSLRTRQGEIQYQRGRYAEAYQSYRRIWRLYAVTGDRRNYAVALSNLGEMSRLRGQLWRARVLTESALAEFAAIGNALRQAYTENHLAMVYLNLQEWDASEAHFLQGLALLAPEEQQARAYLHQNLGLLYMTTQQFEKAQETFRQALALYQALGDEASAAQIYSNLGNLYQGVGLFAEAEEVCRQAERILKRINDGLNLARARHNLGMACAGQRRWDEAERCFQQALAHWRAREDRWNIANTLVELGNLYLAQGQRARAHLCLEEGEALIRDQGAPWYVQLRAEFAELRQRWGG